MAPRAKGRSFYDAPREAQHDLHGKSCPRLDDLRLILPRGGGPSATLRNCPMAALRSAGSQRGLFLSNLSGFEGRRVLRSLGSSLLQKPRLTRT
jgi:hypothetical protein